MSEWTTDTLREFLLAELKTMRDENNQRFAAQEKNVETAFNAAKEAVIKSEIGVEKRSDAVYVTITKLQDALAAVMPRSEAEQRFGSLAEKIDSLKTSSDTVTGKSNGLNTGWSYLLGVAGLVSIVVGLVLALTN